MLSDDEVDIMMICSNETKCLHSGCQIHRNSDNDFYILLLFTMFFSSDNVIVVPIVHRLLYYGSLQMKDSDVEGNCQQAPHART